ncbi:MAG: hypothetical protein H5T50_06380 [Nitrososphaeria archaeon]|nr:hypothetical protein [Nitrososphaeria archaeon]
MVKEIIVGEKKVYLCEVCGLGYANKSRAKECEHFCKKYKACSLEITRYAIYYP